MGRRDRIETHSPEETIDLGKHLAKSFQPGEVVCFFGDLGTGKTTLIKGIVEELTGEKSVRVCSPTFSYLNIYPGICPVFHFDLYRLNDIDAFFSMGFDEYLFGKGISCIEWSERIEAILPSHAHRIYLEYLGKEKRKIKYEISKYPVSDQCCKH